MITVNKGQYVKLFLRNGMALEGIVEESTAAQVVLQSLNDQSLMIIHRPNEDIMLTKIMVELPPMSEQKEEPAPPPEPTEMQTQIKSKLHEVLLTEDPDLKDLSIEELRLLVRQQDKYIIEQKKKEHFGSPGNAKMTHYSSPYSPMRTVGRKIVPRKGQ
jgi:sRNA-binding regulator protein Hfq